MEGVKDLCEHFVVLLCGGVPERRHSEIYRVVLIERKSVNSSHNNGFPRFHRIKRCNVKFDPNIIGEITALADLHVYRFDASRDNLVNLRDGLLYHLINLPCSIGFIFEIRCPKSLSRFVYDDHEVGPVGSL